MTGNKICSICPGVAEASHTQFPAASARSDGHAWESFHRLGQAKRLARACSHVTFRPAGAGSSPCSPPRIPPKAATTRHPATTRFPSPGRIPHCTSSVSTRGTAPNSPYSGSSAQRISQQAAPAAVSLTRLPPWNILRQEHSSNRNRELTAE